MKATAKPIITYIRNFIASVFSFDLFIVIPGDILFVKKTLNQLPFFSGFPAARFYFFWNRSSEAYEMPTLSTGPHHKL